LFYMIKGDMCLKVVEHGKFKDIPIKEGEIFLLPACIAHSPQRNANTIGFVVERERDETELDGLRFFASEQYKTGKPIPGTIPENPPIVLDSEINLQMPFNFKKWINENRNDLDTKGHVQLFPATFQFDVKVYGKGTNSEQCKGFEIWIWQIEGTSSVSVDGKDYKLEANDTMLVLDGQKYTAVRPVGGVALICHQDPARKKKL
ncbi:3-hydroxyanthranilate 3,4-dioxygenase, partial [Elysia marginata]